MMTRHKSKKAFTLVEVIISAFLLGMLLAMAFFIYTMGARAWAKGDAKSELLQAVQILSAKTGRLVESSTSLSVSVAPDGSMVAFLSAEDSNGVFQYDPVTRLPIWQKYIVLYHVPSESIVYYREEPVLGTAIETNPQTIDNLAGNAVEDYANSGRPIARGIDVCTFGITADNQLLTQVSSTKKRYGSEKPERQSARFLSSFRNG